MSADDADSWAVRAEDLIADAKKDCYYSNDQMCELLRIQIRLQAEMLDRLELLFKPTIVLEERAEK
jgi:hypothetical protein